MPKKTHNTVLEYSMGRKGIHVGVEQGVAGVNNRVHDSPSSNKQTQ